MFKRKGDTDACWRGEDTYQPRSADLSELSQSKINFFSKTLYPTESGEKKKSTKKESFKILFLIQLVWRPWSPEIKKKKTQETFRKTTKQELALNGTRPLLSSSCCCPGELPSSAWATLEGQRLISCPSAQEAQHEVPMTPGLPSSIPKMSWPAPPCLLLPGAGPAHQKQAQDRLPQSTPSSRAGWLKLAANSPS